MFLLCSTELFEQQQQQQCKRCCSECGGAMVRWCDGEFKGSTLFNYISRLAHNFFAGCCILHDPRVTFMMMFLFLFLCFFFVVCASTICTFLVGTMAPPLRLRCKKVNRRQQHFFALLYFCCNNNVVNIFFGCCTSFKLKQN